MTGETTEAVVFEAYGDPDVLKLASIPIDPPGPGQVRIRTWATPVNPADVWLRQGGIAALMDGAVWPVVPGLELAGEVESVGADVDLRPGQAVVAITTFVGTGRGAQAELVNIRIDDVARLPDGVDPVAASALPMSGLTALMAIDRLDLDPGATVGVIGGGGTVGGFVVQLAHERGLRVIATAGAADAEKVRSLGADVVVVSRAPEAIREYAPDGVDGLVDTAVLGAGVLPALRPGSVLAVLRPLSAEDAQRVAAAGVASELISVRAYQGDRRRLQGLVDRAADGRLVLRGAETRRPADVASAHRQMEAGGVRARIVLDWR